MSLMAGFDFVAEISNATLLDLIKAQVRFGTELANPPFEVSIPINSGGSSGYAHVIVDDLKLNLNGDDTIALTMHFTDSSVVVTSPSTLVIAPLDGTISINSDLALASAGAANQMAVATDLQSATVALNFSPAAQNQINNSFQGNALAAAAFQASAEQAVTGFIHSLGQQQFPVVFSVVPGTDGALTPAPQFEELEVHCISAADPANQALGIFGNFLLADHGNGDHTQKTATAITAGHNVCMSLSPGAFHALLFCPGVASALGATAAQLPTTCGGAQGFDTGGATLKSVQDSFADGHIDVNGTITKSAFCFDANGSFHATITATVSGDTLTPNVKVDPPNVNVDIPWYCWLVAGFVLGPIGILITGIVTAIAQNIAQNLADSAVKGALGNGFGSSTINGLNGASFDTATITVEGLTLEGTVALPLPATQERSLALVGSVVLDSQQQLSTGTYTDTFCNLGDFPYTEYAQQQTGTYSLKATLLGQPLQVQWTLDGVVLDAANGNLSIPNVPVQFPFPLPGGTGHVQSVNIAYSISDNTITLTNAPADGNYSLELFVQATDPSGIVMQAVASVQFEGDSVVIGNGYGAKFAACIRKMSNKLAEAEWYDHIPLPVPANYPAPETLVNLIHEVVISPAPIADTLLTAIRLQHGSSFLRAISSEAATKAGLPEKIGSR